MSAWRPSASITSAVPARLPGKGLVFDFFRVDECSRASPSWTVRAVMATSYPARARCCAQTLPMPRLAPVMKATF
jgi:hypothetical protein